MVTDVSSEEIGAAAGAVWHYLKENGSVAVSRLAKDIDAPRDVVMQAVGWLAREGKIRFEKNARTRKLSLIE